MSQARTTKWLFIVLVSFSALLHVHAEETGLPEGVQPMPRDLAKKMTDLLKGAEKFRGLPCKHRVASGSVDEESLRKKMLLAFQEELPEAKMNPLEATLKAFTLIPDSMSLAKYYPELLTSQVGGFYDPRRKYLVIVNREGGLLGKAGREQLGPLADKMEETVLVHELVHAIQDQHFDLQKYCIEDPLSDTAMARTAVVEGDATLVMYNYFAGMNLEEMPGADQIIGSLLKDPNALIEMSPDMPGSKEMAAAPAWFRENLLFSYMQGYVFCMNVKKAGGQKLLDVAFTVDPPRSTEQILHPEKWHKKRDDPIKIEWPDLSNELPGYKKVSENDLGEQTIKVLLSENIKPKDGEKETARAATLKQAETAAAGWGGDRFAVYTKGDERLLLWIIDWDTGNDAFEFVNAARAMGNNWISNPCEPKRVVLMRGKLDDATWTAVKTKLAGAKATLPENKPLDFAALKIEAKNTDDGGLGNLLKDESVQKMMKEMLSQERPAGKLSDDKRTYTNDALGFKITLPESAKEWKFDAKPMAPIAFQITDPTAKFSVNMVAQGMPFPIEIDGMGPMIEMGLKMQLKEYKKLSESKVETNGKKGIELFYEAQVGPMKTRMLQRMYSIDGKMLVLSAAADPEAWPANEKTVKDIFGAFTIFPKIAADPKDKPAGEK